ncbi:LuxR family transcriptional regulator [Magnetovibrio sp. PR-2]|uniref:helix-turn-helix transcriptional regulator n=1 Tax=Magnetovibrio sp. PR-2 TaxID=3120356 RepID=UPI002FCE5DA0
MTAKVAQFIEESMGATSPQDLFSLYCASLSALGIDRAVYSAMRNTPRFETKVPAIFCSYPEDWVKYYFENGFIEADPVRIRGLHTRRAFTWDSMMAQHDLNNAEQEIMDLGEEAGLKSGSAMVFHGPMGEAFGVGLACSEHNPDVEHHLKEIEILSTQFHVQFSAHFGQDQSSKAPLTPRELEILKWVASGKSNWAIGEILALSEHGVEYHVRNILKKMDADSRLSAVVKALYNGYLTL